MYKCSTFVGFVWRALRENQNFANSGHLGGACSIHAAETSKPRAQLWPGIKTPSATLGNKIFDDAEGQTGATLHIDPTTSARPLSQAVGAIRQHRKKARALTVGAVYLGLLALIVTIF